MRGGTTITAQLVSSSHSRGSCHLSFVWWGTSKLSHQKPVKWASAKAIHDAIFEASAINLKRGLKAAATIISKCHREHSCIMRDWLSHHQAKNSMPLSFWGRQSLIKPSKAPTKATSAIISFQERRNCSKRRLRVSAQQFLSQRYTATYVCEVIVYLFVWGYFIYASKDFEKPWLS